MPPKVRKPADAVGLKISFKESLRQKLEDAASKSHRSMTAEIVHRLEQSFEMEAKPAFDFTDDVRDLLMLYFLGDRTVEQDHDLADIIVDVIDKVMDAAEADRIKLLGKLLANRLESEHKKHKNK